MNISFYAPFKPLGHPDPSGDLTIGTGLHAFLIQNGHLLQTVSTLRCRWIYWKPWMIPKIIREMRRSRQTVQRKPTDCWLTYHSYYKAPDMIGPWVCRNQQIPYVIFQGVYATKRRKVIKTFPGYALNTHALRSADHVFTNKRMDLLNLKRLLPADRLTYVTPGIFPEKFSFSAAGRRDFRNEWNVGDDPVILAAAMFRPDVKTAGLKIVIRACGTLFRKGRKFHLVIAGDGGEKQTLQALAEKEVPGRVRFIGKVPTKRMNRFYSAGELFAFPGIRESLGMVFLEAQSCGIPVVAFSNAGTPEVIRHRITGLLVPAFDFEAFVYGMETLLDNGSMRRHMGQAGKQYVRKHHDLNANYKIVETVLMELCGRRRT